MLRAPAAVLRLPLLLLGVGLTASCNDLSDGVTNVPGEPPGPAGNFQPIIHTVDGRHLAFRPESFEPNAIEHCREDGERHLTSIFELSRMSPVGWRDSLCPELSGRFLQLYLTFYGTTRPAIKVTTLCGDGGCLAPGGFYDPVHTVIRVPWSEVSYIEFRR